MMTNTEKKTYDLEERTLRFAMRIKICRKEAKETVHRLKLIQIKSEASEKIRGLLIGEASESTKMFGAIVTKTEV
jgi:hypothetical protein